MKIDLKGIEQAYPMLLLHHARQVLFERGIQVGRTQGPPSRALAEAWLLDKPKFAGMTRATVLRKASEAVANELPAIDLAKYIVPTTPKAKPSRKPTAKTRSKRKPSRPPSP